MGPCVHVSVCPSQVEVQSNGWTDWVGFWHRSYPLLFLKCVVSQCRCLQKINGTSLWNLIPESELSQSFCFFSPRHVNCAVVVNLVDQLLSPVHHAERPPLFTPQCAQRTASAGTCLFQLLYESCADFKLSRLTRWKLKFSLTPTFSQTSWQRSLWCVNNAVSVYCTYRRQCSCGLECSADHFRHL